MTLILFGKLAAQSYDVGKVVYDKGNTAMMDAEKKYKIDKNGVKNSLIIVSFSGTDAAGRSKFGFDGGSSASIVKEEREGEIWVFITSGTTHLKITHNDYGNQDISFSSALKANMTYKLQIKVKEKKKDETIKNVKFTTEGQKDVYVEIMVGDEPTVSKTPYIIPMLLEGEYNVRLSKEDYQTIDTIVNVTKTDNAFNFRLKEDFATITINTDDGATIIINDSRKGDKRGIGSWQGTLLSGVYEVTISKKSHKTKTTKITVDAGVDKTYDLTQLTPIYGSLEIKCNTGAYSLYIDEKKVPTSSNKTIKVNNLLIGNHKVLVKKLGYYDKSSDVVITENKTSSLSFMLIKDWIERDKLKRTFLNFTYSTRGNVGLMGGGMYENRLGFYAGYEFGFGGIAIYPNMKSDIKRISLGGAYALNDWWYIYGGPALTENITDSDTLHTFSADLGMMFRLSGVSLLAGVQYDVKAINTPNFSINAGLGFTLTNENEIDFSQLSLVFSPSAPIGVMWTLHKPGIGMYVKTQSSYLEKQWRKDNHRKRYSFTVGANYHITDWLSCYMGAGVGATKNYSEEEAAYVSPIWGADLETGLAFNIKNYVTLSLGAHRVNAFDLKNTYTEFDIGLGAADLFREDNYLDTRTIIEYSGSFTALIGVNTGIIYDDGWGYYARFQKSSTKNTFADSLANTNNEFWKGHRASLTLGPILSLTNYMSLHGGIGAGIYYDNASAKQNVGFEAEIGASLYFGPVSLSIGPHWCNIGNTNGFLDWNFGGGVALKQELDMNEYCTEGATLFKYTYSPGAPVGLEIGGLYGAAGLYGGIQFGEKRYNFSIGPIISASAFSEIQFGIGFGIYGNEEPEPEDIYDVNYEKWLFRFDLEAEYNLNIGPLPISIGAKFCKVGHDDFFVETMLGIGIIKTGKSLLFF